MEEVKCHLCGKDYPEDQVFRGFIAMTLPSMEMESRKDKWGGDKWYEHLERTDLTHEEFKELDDINLYDQLLNTVGRGIQCMNCCEEEDKFYINKGINSL